MLLSQLGPGSFCPLPVTQPTTLCHQASVVAPTLSLQEGVGGAGQPPTTTIRGPSQCLSCPVGFWEEAELLPSLPPPALPGPRQAQSRCSACFPSTAKSTVISRAPRGLVGEARGCFSA